MEWALIVLVCCAGVCYIAAFVLYAYQLRSASDAFKTLPTWFAGGGLLCQTAWIGVAAVEHSGTQLSGANIIMLASWTIMLGYFIFERVSRRRSYGVFIIPVVLIGMSIAWGLGAGGIHEEGTIVYAAWPLLVLHIICYFVAAAVFLLGGASAIMLIYQENHLKHKKVDVVKSRMPGLSFLKKVMRRSTLIGLPIFILGIMLGITRAAGLEIDYWWTSPRIILSLIVLAFYCVIAVQTYLIRVSSTVIARMTIVASVLVIILTVFSAVLPMLGTKGGWL